MAKRERFKMSVSVFLFLRDGNKILVLKRAQTGWMDGYFSVPAGAIDGDKTLIEAVAREAQEEVGVIVQAAALKLVHTMHCFTGEDEWLGQFFMADSWQGEPRLGEPEKHSDLQWVEMDALPDEMIPYVRQAIVGSSQGAYYSTYRDIESH